MNNWIFDIPLIKNNLNLVIKIYLLNPSLLFMPRHTTSKRICSHTPLVTPHLTTYAHTHRSQVARTRTHPPRSSCESRCSESVQCPVSAEETGEKIRIQGEVSVVEKRRVFVYLFVCLFCFVCSVSFCLLCSVFLCLRICVCLFIHLTSFVAVRESNRGKGLSWFFLFQRFHYAYVADGEVE
jgi:hypothetical protein